MFNGFLKVFLFTSVMFAAVEGFGGGDLNSLYQEKLLTAYNSIKPQKELAKKRKITYIISAILAVIVFLFFAKFFKLTGVIVSLIMIGAGYYVLKNSSTNEIGDYESLYKKSIITPIAQSCCGFEYESDSLDKSIFKKSDIFLPAVKEYASWDLYKSKDARFSYIKATFDTKESASVERMNENIFEGYFIILDKKNPNEGILVSDSLREKVSNMDIEMNSFFANASRGKKVGSFTIYGDIQQHDIDKVGDLEDKMIAISYKKDKTYIAVYKSANPLKVDVLKDFDLNSAKSYQQQFIELENLIQKIK